MKIIARSEYSDIIDDGDYWLVYCTFPGKEGVHKRVLKEDNPFYPLAMIMKYDAEPVDHEFLEKLGKKMRNQ